MILFLYQLCFTLFCCLFVAQPIKTPINKGLLLSVSESNKFIYILLLPIVITGNQVNSHL